MSYAEIITDVLKREGWPKFTDDPNDRGGPTRGGITLSMLSKFRKQPVTVEQLKALEEPEARAIYETVFIVEPGFMRIADEEVREYLIDTGVTSSPARAVRYLQRCLGFAPAQVDGVLGSQTAAAANAVDPVDLLLKLIAYRAVKIAAFVQEDPTQLKYLEGWIARAVKPLEA